MNKNSIKKMIVLDREAVKEMLIAQFKLNAAIAGDSWVLGLSKDKKIMNWARYCFMEGAETVDSYPYKHWKNIKDGANMRNVQIELSDIWHFLLSLIIENEFLEYLNESNIQDLQDVNFYELFINTEILEKCVSAMLVFEHDFDINGNYQLASIKSDYQELPYIEKFISLAANVSTEKMYRDSLEPSSFDLRLLTYLFHKICSIIELNIEVLYYAKGELNKFRQLNGYKDGSYIKIWTIDNQKFEDNEILFDLVDKKVPVEKLIAELTMIYNSMTVEFKLHPDERLKLEKEYTQLYLLKILDSVNEKDYTLLEAFISGNGAAQVKALKDSQLVDELAELSMKEI